MSGDARAEEEYNNVNYGCFWCWTCKEASGESGGGGHWDDVLGVIGAGQDEGGCQSDEDLFLDERLRSIEQIC